MVSQTAATDQRERVVSRVSSVCFNNRNVRQFCCCTSDKLATHSHGQSRQTDSHLPESPNLATREVVHKAINHCIRRCRFFGNFVHGFIANGSAGTRKLERMILAQYDMGTGRRCFRFDQLPIIQGKPMHRCVVNLTAPVLYSDEQCSLGMCDTHTSVSCGKFGSVVPRRVMPSLQWYSGNSDELGSAFRLTRFNDGKTLTVMPSSLTMHISAKTDSRCSRVFSFRFSLSFHEFYDEFFRWPATVQLPFPYCLLEPVRVHPLFDDDNNDTL